MVEGMKCGSEKLWIGVFVNFIGVVMLFVKNVKGKLRSICVNEF